VNGKPVGESVPGIAGRSGKQFDIASLLGEGKNVIAIEAENLPAPSANPAGLIAKLEMRFDNDQTQSIVTDAQWLATMEKQENWDTVDANESKWDKALVAAHYGDKPWGKIEAQDNSELTGPQSTGSADVRVVYVPDPQPIELRELSKGKELKASWFDPTTGETKDLPKVKAAANGTSRVDPPKIDHDWVLVLKQ
jgi:hypothetical protein